jgi:hypothetical protein
VLKGEDPSQTRERRYLGHSALADRFRYIHPIFAHSLFIALMMEAERASETSVCFSELLGAISHRVVIFILAAVRI